MTPAARYAAAASLLDEISDGRAAEQALTNWARRSRFAGSGDRAALRDIVFDALRRKRSAAARGGGETGRALILGLLREAGDDPDAVFTGARYALAPLTKEERAGGNTPVGAAALDMPDWLLPDLRESLGAALEPVCHTLRQRAEVHLRWHEGRTGAEQAMQALQEDGIETERHPLAPTALRVVQGARRVRQAAAYRDGRVELQDAASQAVCAALDVQPGTRVLDYCAGGGGKSLALAARGADVWAYDADAARMADLPVRAARAGDTIKLLKTQEITPLAPFDLVLVDAPCSGSGAWRRQVEGKWRLTRDGLDRLTSLQAQILDAAARHVRPGGVLAYATCSLLASENGRQIDAFAARCGTNAPWRELRRDAYSPLDGGDGFFLAIVVSRPAHCTG
ncbi:MAG: RsmB/NOP family class I SAM-dependent RNA methyltransferase [Pseudomonadota bacterium]